MGTIGGQLQLWEPNVLTQGTICASLRTAQVTVRAFPRVTGIVALHESSLAEAVCPSSTALPLNNKKINPCVPTPAQQWPARFNCFHEHL